MSLGRYTIDFLGLKFGFRIFFSWKMKRIGGTKFPHALSAWCALFGLDFFLIGCSNGTLGTNEWLFYDMYFVMMFYLNPRS